MMQGWHLDENGFPRLQMALPHWAGWRTAEAGPSDGQIALVYGAPSAEAPALPDAADEALVSWFLAHEPQVSASVQAELLSRWPDLMDDLAEDPDSLPPAPRSIEALRDWLMLTDITVHTQGRDGIPYLGYAFEAAHDIEHGLGVLMHGPRVVAIGFTDTAWCEEAVRSDREGG